MNQKNYIFACLLIFVLLSVFQGCKDSKEISEHEKLNSIFTKANEVDQQSESFYHLADSAYKLSMRLNEGENIEKSLWYLGNYYFAKNKYKEAINKYNLSINYHKGKEPDSILGHNYNSIARSYFRMKIDSLAIKNFKIAAAVRMAIGDSTGYGVAMNNAGYVYWTSSSFDSALVYFEKALSVREKLQNSDHMSSTLNNIGTIYFNWSIYDKALDYYSRVLKYTREINKPGDEANTLCNIGLVYERTNQPLSAREYFKEAYHKAVEAQDTQRIGYVYTNLGLSFYWTNLDSSIYYFNKSLETYKSIKFPGGQLIAKEGLGKCYLDLNDIRKAKEYFTEIKNIAIEENIQIRHAIALKYLGIIEHKLKNYDEAIALLNESNEIAEYIHTKSILVDNYKELGEIFETIDRIPEALKATKTYLSYKNEIDNEGMKRRLSESKKQFELEKVKRMMDANQFQNERESIILIFTLSIITILVIMLIILYRVNIKRQRAHKLLAERNVKIETQKEELLKTNTELNDLTKSKDKFYSIVAHDLKNPFLTLYGYTDLLKNNFYELRDTEKLEYISELETITKKTYLLLENLLEISSLRTGIIQYEPSNFILTDSVSAIVEMTTPQAKSKGIRILNFIPSYIRVKADKTMIDTVIRNLLTNAVKFSHPGGNIKLHANENDDLIIVSVEDDGIGISREVLNNLFEETSNYSTRGTNDEKGSGLGLEICKEFILKNNGEFWAESKLNEGSTFYFSLPKGIETAPDVSLFLDQKQLDTSS
ncbi:MAG: tetratricopeptide repeat-containing sensor histidine kinase [Bacteroidetes bacterium]|nr:tetratricopeptide repeat-containing sensor histidine kinase [Bacteroidota bacterium]